MKFDLKYIENQIKINILKKKLACINLELYEKQKKYYFELEELMEKIRGDKK